MHEQYPENHSFYYGFPLPYALREEYIDSAHIDPGREWIRFIVDEFFDPPYCVVLERAAGRTYCTVKLTDGKGLYHTGQLVLTYRQEMPDSLTNAFFGKLDSVDFWHLGKDTSCHVGEDGSRWEIEAMIHGKYNYVHRWAPDGCGNSTTRLLAAMGEYLGSECDLPVLKKTSEQQYMNANHLMRRVPKAKVRR